MPTSPGHAIATILIELVCLAIVGTSPGVADSNAWPAPADTWFRSVDRSEAILSGSTLGGTIGPADRGAVLEQFQIGAASLRSLVESAFWADSLVPQSFTPAPPPPRRQGQWGNRFIKATSITAVSMSLAGIVASSQGASLETRNMLGIVSGAVGGTGALFSLLRPRPAPPPFVDPNERARTALREMLLRDTYSATQRSLRDLASELDAIHAITPSTDSAAVSLARHYATALEHLAALSDIQIPNAAVVARQCSTYPSFSVDARRRLNTLADHMEHAAAEWRAWRWLIGRSERNALGFLALVERP